MYTLNRSEQFGTRRTSTPPRHNRPQRYSAEPHVPAGESLPVITPPTSQNARRMPRSTFCKSNACTFASHTFPHPRQRTSTPTQPPAMTRAESLRLALVHHVHRFAHFPKCIFSQRAHCSIAVMQHIEHVVTLLRKLGAALSIRLQKAVHTLRNVCFQRA